MKKPPRKSKEEKVLTNTDMSSQTESAHTQISKNNKMSNLNTKVSDSEECKTSVVSPPSSSISSGSHDIHHPASKAFKMLRLFKMADQELGIIISKKRNPHKNTTGYEIAHIDPDGLIHR